MGNRSAHRWAIAALLALYSLCASAQDAICPAPGTGGEIRRNLDIVARCELTNVEIRGNVTLFAGGSLIARDVHIRGNLDGDRADFVDLDDSRIDGHVRLAELVGDLSKIESTEVGRDVDLTGNRSRLELQNNDLGGDLRVTANTGGVLLAGNAIDDDLRCTGNTPAPVGFGNRVDDDAAGQCANLRPEEPPPAPPEPPPPETPPETPPPETPPPQTPPPPTPPPSEPPPTSDAPPSTPEPGEPTDSEVDDGGAGALGWPTLLLLAPLVGRRFASRRSLSLAQRAGAASR